jgi:hypothetical protein
VGECLHADRVDARGGARLGDARRHDSHRPALALVGGDLATERMLAGDELVEHDAEREHIGPGRQRLAARLLGRHVRPLAFDHAGAVAFAAGDAEIGDANLARGREQ